MKDIDKQIEEKANKIIKQTFKRLKNRTQEKIYEDLVSWAKQTTPQKE